MKPALIKLLYLRFRGAVRRTLGKLRTPRGALYASVTTIVLLVWFGPMLIASQVSPRRGEMATANRSAFRDLTSVFLLVSCVSAILIQSESALHFRPAEVNFLFSGPFSRRQLLAYKLLGTVLTSVIPALFFGILIGRYGRHWSTVLVGIFLNVVFVRLFSIAISLVGQTVTARAFSWGRRAVVAAVAVLLGVGLWYAAPTIEGNDAAELWSSFRSSTAATILLAPFDVFSRAIWAERFFPELVGWALAALAVNAALVVLILWLDANYLEAAVTASEHRYQLIERVRRGRSVWTPGRSVRWRIPRLPWLWGAGPIVRRNLTDAIRQSYLVLAAFFLVAVLVGPVLRIVGAPRDALFFVLGLIAWVSFFGVPQALKFDFRIDIDSLDWLKSLPLSPLSVASGELIVPVALATLLHWTAAAGLATLAGSLWPWLFAWGCFAAPFNLLLFGLENLTFLLFPMRQGPAAADSFGRRTIEWFIKMIVLFLVALVAAVPAAFVYFLLGRSWLAGGAVAWLVLSAVVLAVVPIVAWAFRTFDVSQDMPG